MLGVVRSRWALSGWIASCAIVIACGGRLDGGEEAPSALPPSTPFGPEKLPQSAPLPSKPSTSGRVDWSFGGTGSTALPSAGALPVCLLTSATGEIWVAARPMTGDADAARTLVQLDPRGSLDERVSELPDGAPKGTLARLVGLEACARTPAGTLVIAHRGGQLGSQELPVSPGVAYVSLLLATSPVVAFETVIVPFPALALEVAWDGSYVVAADQPGAEMTLARVRRDGTRLPPVEAPPLPGFRVRRLVRDGRSVVVAGMVDGSAAYPSAALGRLESGRVTWTTSRQLADLETSLAPRDRFGLSVDDVGHAYVAIGPGVTVGRFAAGATAVDEGFGDRGKVQLTRDGVTWDAVAVAGSRLVVATSAGLVRMTEDGELDPGYGEGGRAPIHYATSQPLRISGTPDGAVLLAGLGPAGAVEVTRFTP